MSDLEQPTLKDAKKKSKKGISFSDEVDPWLAHDMEDMEEIVGGKKTEVVKPRAATDSVDVDPSLAVAYNPAETGETFDIYTLRATPEHESRRKSEDAVL